jgi:hypothetical protein
MADPEISLNKLKNLLESDPNGVAEDLQELGQTFEPSASTVELLANACRSRMRAHPLLTI